MKTVLFPGSFDPITFGHINLLNRASQLADEVIVAVAQNSSKGTLFTLDERCALVKAATAHLPNIKVEPFCGLLVEFAQKHNAHALVRGIRGGVDADYELKLAHLNRTLDPQLDTILLPADASTAFISSTVVKEVHKHQGSIKQLAPNCVQEALNAKINPNRSKK